MFKIFLCTRKEEVKPHHRDGRSIFFDAVREEETSQIIRISQSSTSSEQSMKEISQNLQKLNGFGRDLAVDILLNCDTTSEEVEFLVKSLNPLFSATYSLTLQQSKFVVAVGFVSAAANILNCLQTSLKCVSGMPVKWILDEKLRDDLARNLDAIRRTILDSPRIKKSPNVCQTFLLLKIVSLDIGLPTLPELCAYQKSDFIGGKFDLGVVRNAMKFSFDEELLSSILNPFCLGSGSASQHILKSNYQKLSLFFYISSCIDQVISGKSSVQPLVSIRNRLFQYIQYQRKYYEMKYNFKLYERSHSKADFKPTPLDINKLETDWNLHLIKDLVHLVNEVAFPSYHRQYVDSLQQPVPDTSYSSTTSSSAFPRVREHSWEIYAGYSTMVTNILITIFYGILDRMYKNYENEFRQRKKKSKKSKLTNDEKQLLISHFYCALDSLAIPQLHNRNQLYDMTAQDTLLISFHDHNFEFKYEVPVIEYKQILDWIQTMWVNDHVGMETGHGTITLSSLLKFGEIRNVDGYKVDRGLLRQAKWANTITKLREELKFKNSYDSTVMVLEGWVGQGVEIVHDDLDGLLEASLSNIRMKGKEYFIQLNKKFELIRSKHTGVINEELKTEIIALSTLFAKFEDFLTPIAKLLSVFNTNMIKTLRMIHQTQKLTLKLSASDGNMVSYSSALRIQQNMLNFFDVRKIDISFDTMVSGLYDINTANPYERVEKMRLNKKKLFEMTTIIRSRIQTTRDWLVMVKLFVEHEKQTLARLYNDVNNIDKLDPGKNLPNELKRFLYQLLVQGNLVYYFKDDGMKADRPISSTTMAQGGVASPTSSFMNSAVQQAANPAVPSAPSSSILPLSKVIDALDLLLETRFDGLVSATADMILLGSTDAIKCLKDIRNIPVFHIRTNDKYHTINTEDLVQYISIEVVSKLKLTFNTINPVMIKRISDSGTSRSWHPIKCGLLVAFSYLDFYSNFLPQLQNISGKLLNSVTHELILGMNDCHAELQNLLQPLLSKAADEKNLGKSSYEQVKSTQPASMRNAVLNSVAITSKSHHNSGNRKVNPPSPKDKTVYVVRDPDEMLVREKTVYIVQDPTEINSTSVLTTLESYLSTLKDIFVLNEDLNIFQSFSNAITLKDVFLQTICKSFRIPSENDNNQTSFVEDTCIQELTLSFSEPSVERAVNVLKVEAVEDLKESYKHFQDTVPAEDSVHDHSSSRLVNPALGSYTYNQRIQENNWRIRDISAFNTNRLLAVIKAKNLMERIRKNMIQRRCFELNDSARRMLQFDKNICNAVNKLELSCITDESLRFISSNSEQEQLFIIEAYAENEIEITSEVNSRINLHRNSIVLIDQEHDGLLKQELLIKSCMEYYNLKVILQNIRTLNIELNYHAQIITNLETHLDFIQKNIFRLQSETDALMKPLRTSRDRGSEADISKFFIEDPPVDLPALDKKLTEIHREIRHFARNEEKGSSRRSSSIDSTSKRHAASDSAHTGDGGASNDMLRKMLKGMLGSLKGNLPSQITIPEEAFSDTGDLYENNHIIVSFFGTTLRAMAQELSETKSQLEQMKRLEDEKWKSSETHIRRLSEETRELKSDVRDLSRNIEKSQPAATSMAGVPSSSKIEEESKPSDNNRTNEIINTLEQLNQKLDILQVNIDLIRSHSETPVSPAHPVSTVPTAAVLEVSRGDMVPKEEEQQRSEQYFSSIESKLSDLFYDLNEMKDQLSDFVQSSQKHQLSSGNHEMVVKDQESDTVKASNGGGSNISNHQSAIQISEQRKLHQDLQNNLTSVDGKINLLQYRLDEVVLRLSSFTSQKSSSSTLAGSTSNDTSSTGHEVEVKSIAASGQMTLSNQLQLSEMSIALRAIVNDVHDMKTQHQRLSSQHEEIIGGIESIKDKLPVLTDVSQIDKKDSDNTYSDQLIEILKQQLLEKSNELNEALVASEHDKATIRGLRDEVEALREQSRATSPTRRNSLSSQVNAAYTKVSTNGESSVAAAGGGGMSYESVLRTVVEGLRTTVIDIFHIMESSVGVAARPHLPEVNEPVNESTITGMIFMLTDNLTKELKLKTKEIMELKNKIQERQQNSQSIGMLQGDIIEIKNSLKASVNTNKLLSTGALHVIEKKLDDIKLGMNLVKESLKTNQISSGSLAESMRPVINDKLEEINTKLTSILRDGPDGRPASENGNRPKSRRESSNGAASPVRRPIYDMSRKSTKENAAATNTVGNP